MEQEQMILCDTNIFIEIYCDNTDVIKTAKQIGQHNMAVSDVTCAELLFGARNKKELSLIRKDINKLTILPISSDVSAMAVLFALSHKLALPDAL